MKVIQVLMRTGSTTFQAIKLRFYMAKWGVNVKIINLLPLLFFLFILVGCGKNNSLSVMGKGIPIPLPGTYTYHIKSIPEGADIYFNGKHKGKTPLKWKRTLLLQTIETNEIKVKLANHEDGVVSGRIYGGSPKKEKNATVQKWGARTTIHFNLPLLPEVRMKISQAWEKAKNIDTVISYKQFLQQYPNSEYSEQAHRFIKDQEQEDFAWKLAKSSDSIVIYTNFINKFPDSKFSQDAHSKLKAIEKQIIYESTVAKPVASAKSSSQALNDIQKKLGYQPDTIDGYRIKNTEVSNNKFQNDNELMESKRIDDEPTKDIEAKSSITSGTEISFRKKDKTASIQVDKPNIAELSATPDEKIIIEAIKKDLRESGFKSGPVGSNWSIQVRINDIQKIKADPERLHVFAKTGISNDQMEVPHGFIDYFILQKNQNGKWISQIVRKGDH